MVLKIYKHSEKNWVIGSENVHGNVTFVGSNKSYHTKEGAIKALRRQIEEFKKAEEKREARFG